jgi:hypothetical protein
MQPQITEERHARSPFVTIVAWCSLIFAGPLAAFFGWGSFIAFRYFPPFKVALGAGPDLHELSRISESISILRVGYLICFGLSATALMAAIGLLRRRKWARIAMITISSILIATGIGVLSYKLFMLFSAFNWPVSKLLKDAAGFVYDHAVALGGIMLLVWVIKRLSSAAVRNEFR